MASERKNQVSETDSFIWNAIKKRIETPARKKETEFKTVIPDFLPTISSLDLKSLPSAISEMPVRENFVLMSIIKPHV